MLEGYLLKHEDRLRLEAAVKRTGWSWVTASEAFGLRLDQMTNVRRGKRQWLDRFTEYLEAVADAVESVPKPMPQGQAEVDIGSPGVPGAAYPIAQTQPGNPTPMLAVSAVAEALADLFMAADATEDAHGQAMLDQVVERLGIEAEVVALI